MSQRVPNEINTNFGGMQINMLRKLEQVTGQYDFNVFNYVMH